MGPCIRVYSISLSQVSMLSGWQLDTLVGRLRKIMHEPNWLVFKLQGVNRFVIHISEYLLFTCMFMLVWAVIMYSLEHRAAHALGHLVFPVFLKLPMLYEILTMLYGKNTIPCCYSNIILY